MLSLLRMTTILCLLSTIAIGISRFFGQIFPAPVVEWSTTTTFLHDTRTGVNDPLPPTDNPELGMISGTEYIPSPNNRHFIMLIGDPSGLDIRILDDSAQIIHAIDSTHDINISNVGWLDDTTLLLVRVTLTTSTFDLMLFDVETATEQLIGTYENSFIVLSPDHNWLALTERLSAYTELIHLIDDHRYQLHPLDSSLVWSDDGRYLASRTTIEDIPYFQVFDTLTSTLGTEAVNPNRLLWSSNSDDLLVQGAHTLILYRDMQVISRISTEDPIVRIKWSPDGRYAYALNSAETAYHLYLVDTEQENPISFLTSIPKSAEINGIAWALDSPVITYFVPSAHQSHVYRITIPDAHTSLITRIPEPIRQGLYIEKLEHYRD